MKKILIIIICCGLFPILSCEKFNFTHETKIALQSIVQESRDSVVTKATVIDIGKDNITEFGICWAENDPPEIHHFKKIIGSIPQKKEYFCAITSLKQKTKYFFRAYILTDTGVIYSPEHSEKKTKTITTSK